ncbi:MAG TPA: hypothetical protein VKV04_10930 [Verrucomicrobiae bacterium]|jgi:hypothetical protein|nr:hypothetical protein [Verrucomicrobiae bacterium]
MNSTRLSLLLIVSFSLLTGGCSSLRPPPADPTAWNGDTWNGDKLLPTEPQTKGEA